jgi:ribosome modulation factor
MECLICKIEALADVFERNQSTVIGQKLIANWQVMVQGNPRIIGRALAECPKNHPMDTTGWLRSWSEGMHKRINNMFEKVKAENASRKVTRR